jgi:hypothetical protein
VPLPQCLGDIVTRGGLLGSLGSMERGNHRDQRCGDEGDGGSSADTDSCGEDGRPSDRRESPGRNVKDEVEATPDLADENCVCALHFAASSMRNSSSEMPESGGSVMVMSAGRWLLVNGSKGSK